MSRRKEREAAFLDQNAGLGHLSYDLIVSAKQTLARALRDRREEVVRLPANHYTPNAIATIVLVTAALEVSMNEAIAMGAEFGAELERKLALPTMSRKFDSVAASQPGFSFAATELRLLVDVRDEIVHYLPRIERSDAGNLPEWSKTLHERGLFIEAPGSDFQFSQKLPSYALAYWSYEVACKTICLFVASLPRSTQNLCEYIPHNFGLYRKICPPADLFKYDATFDLKLTAFDPF